MYRAAISKNKNSQGKGKQFKKAPPAKANRTTGSPVSKILQLQQTIGNQATQMIVREVFSNSHSESEAIPHNLLRRSPGVIGSPLIQRVKINIRPRRSRRIAERERAQRERPASIDELPTGVEPGAIGDLSSGIVTIRLGGPKSLYLCSQDKADELQIDFKRRHVDFERFDLRYFLEDELPDPEAFSFFINYMIFLGAEIGKALAVKNNIIINCKSGKTRTPTIAIIFMFLRTRNMREAINIIADEYKAQRPGVGIDFDRKLSGGRILDNEGKIIREVPWRLGEIIKRVRALRQSLNMQGPINFHRLAFEIYRQRGSYYTQEWNSYIGEHGAPILYHHRISPRRVRELLAIA